MSHAITDEEFKARVADYNRERGATNSPTTNGAEVVSLASGVKAKYCGQVVSMARYVELGR